MKGIQGLFLGFSERPSLWVIEEQRFNIGPVYSNSMFCTNSLWFIKMLLFFLMGSHTLVFLASMSHFVSYFLPSSLMFLYMGSGVFMLGCISQSTSDQSSLVPWSSRRGGGGGKPIFCPVTHLFLFYSHWYADFKLLGSWGCLSLLLLCGPLRW